MIKVYADGACNPVSGQGGWGTAIVVGGRKRVFSGVVKGTTSNRMEITAALEGILQTPEGAEVVVYTDSQYLFGIMTKGWQRRANRDLLERLDLAVGQRKVRWEWLEGDTKNPFHREVHALATNLVNRREAAPGEREEVSTVPVGEQLTHVDALGRPRMVDISGKPDTEREAVARCLVRMSVTSFDLLKRGELPKGDVLSVAKLAGILGAKQTPHLIPLCHTILLGDVKIEFSLDEKNNAIEITTAVKSLGKTGVEMEALTAAAVTALTIYDMCKAVDKSIRIENIRLVRKSGGKSGVVNLE